jgi:hypothetical protein
MEEALFKVPIRTKKKKKRRPLAPNSQQFSLASFARVSCGAKKTLTDVIKRNPPLLNLPLIYRL